MKYLKNSIFSILLLICFSLYAASPICYAYCDQESEKDRNATQQEDSGLHSVSLVLLSLLFSDTNDIKTQETSPVESFLIKQGKALTEGKSDIKNIQTAEISIFAHNLTPSLTGNPLYIQSSLPKPHDDFLAFFTGLAPPLDNS